MRLHVVRWRRIGGLEEGMRPLLIATRLVRAPAMLVHVVTLLVEVETARGLGVDTPPLIGPQCGSPA